LHLDWRSIPTGQFERIWRAIAFEGPPAITAPLALNFHSDSVLKIQIEGLKAIHTILKTHSDFEFRIPIDFGRLMRHSDIRFKFVIMDLFFVQRGLLTPALTFFTNVMVKEHPSVKVHFLQVVADSPFVASLAKEIRYFVSDLLADRQWRNRLTVVELFDIFTLAGEFVSFGFQALEDEAFLVRKAAAGFLGRVFAAEAELPTIVAGLADERTFRKRQAAVWILREIHRGASSELREQAEEMLKALKGDAVAIVASAASEALSGG
jgi:hypothetical protein